MKVKPFSDQYRLALHRGHSVQTTNRHLSIPLWVLRQKLTRGLPVRVVLVTNVDLNIMSRRTPTDSADPGADHADAWNHLVCFAFCKRDETLDEAIRRLAVLRKA